MRKEEKVTIELPACPKKAKAGIPVGSQFNFRPKSFPQLQDSVLDISWNTVAKQLIITMKENSKFEVYEWMNFITEKDSLYEKTPFMDLDANSADLAICDLDKRPVVTLRFKNLRIDNHECHLDKLAPTGSLRHKIVVFYRALENITATKESVYELMHGDVNKNDSNQVADEEWKTDK